MKRLVLLLCLVIGLNVVATTAAQDFYPDFALVVQLPSYETFIKNLGDSPIRVDGYQITSASGSLAPDGWASVRSAGSEAAMALGPGASQFFVANPTKNSLSELNPVSSAVWQPGQSWSIGFPFNSGDANFVRDAVFRFSSPDGLVLTGGTVIPPSALFPAVLLVVPEPSTGVLCVLAAVVLSAHRFTTCR